MATATNELSLTSTSQNIDGVVVRDLITAIMAAENEPVFITDKISWVIKEIIKRARKNFYGIFDEPNDPVNGEEKVWIPLTESLCTTVARAADLDTKDILVRPTTDRAVGPARVLKFVIDYWLEQLRFGELLDQIILLMIRDGTVVVKSWLAWSQKFQKKVLTTKIVDLLNFYIDPSAESIQDASWVCERSLMTVDQFKRYSKGWNNTQNVNGFFIKNTIRDLAMNVSRVPYVEVFDFWGKMPTSYLGQNDGNWIDGHIVISNLFQQPKVHLIEKNKKGIKPYEEARLEAVDGRWHGRGLSEKLFHTQYYLNLIVNMRRNNALILQNGLFEVRKGSGITPDMVNRLYAGGSVLVNRIGEDIRQMPMEDVRQSSYKDEEIVTSWAERLVGSPGSPAQDLTASTPATTALIKQHSSQDTYTFAQEQIGHFIKRLFENHYIPLIIDSLQEDELVRITGSLDSLRELDQAYIDLLAEEQLVSFVSRTNYIPSGAEIASAKQRAMDRLGRLREDRFIKIKTDVFDTAYDIDVDITSEEYDKTVMVQQLRELLLTVSRALPETNLDVNSILREILDLMGLKGNRFFREEKTPMMGALSSGGATSAGPTALDMRTGAMRTPTAPTAEGVFSRSLGNEQRTTPV